ncbi:MAG TPA: hypothetical protein VIJ94_03340 [Caulobacteraceae bacterium]
MSRIDHINLYRKRASEMEMLAAETKFAQMRDSYLRLAEEWDLLADSLERQASASGAWPEAKSASERH